MFPPTPSPPPWPSRFSSPGLQEAGQSLSVKTFEWVCQILSLVEEKRARSSPPAARFSEDSLGSGWFLPNVSLVSLVSTAEPEPQALPEAASSPDDCFSPRTLSFLHSFMWLILTKCLLCAGHRRAPIRAESLSVVREGCQGLGETHLVESAGKGTPLPSPTFIGGVFSRRTFHRSAFLIIVEFMGLGAGG